MQKKLILAMTSAMAVAGCNPVGSAISEQEYSIKKMGMQEISDRKEYSYSKSVTFTATQKYKFKNESGFDEPHWLFLKVTKLSGNTVLRDTAHDIVFIEDGEEIMECGHYFSISNSEEGSLKPVTCTFELIGVLAFDAKAKLHLDKPLAETQAPE